MKTIADILALLTAFERLTEDEVVALRDHLTTGRPHADRMQANAAQGSQAAMGRVAEPCTKPPLCWN